MPASTGSSASLWLPFALMTVAAWGLYGVFLHSGQLGMQDAANGRYKAFLWVGVAYTLIAVLAPLALLVARGATWSMPAGGIAWSLVAGAVGAVGAFCVLLAFGARGNPAVVMSIIFAGAPIVNAAVSLWKHPPARGLGSLSWQFVAGIVLAALGGMLVTLYKPT
jgi:drug/metabolite transporter (DMT)-like permease